MRPPRLGTQRVDVRARRWRDPDEHEPPEHRRKADEGIEEAGHVLVGQRIAGEEEVRGRHAERGERRVQTPGPLGGCEGGAHAIRDDADALRPGAEPLDEVPARRLRDGDQPMGPAHRQTKHDARVEGRERMAVPHREAQVDQIVHRDDRRAGEPGRADVVRRVVEIGTVPAGGERELPQLAYGIGPRGHGMPEGACSPRRD